MARPGGAHRGRHPHCRSRSHVVRRTPERDGGRWTEDGDRNFFRIPDANTVYEFHFYKPFHFTHQSASWVSFTAENVATPTRSAPRSNGSCSTERGHRRQPEAAARRHPLDVLSGRAVQVDDPAIVVGKPVLVVNANAGKVCFDDLVLEQLDAAGKVKRVIWQRNLTGTRGWFFWTATARAGRSPENGQGDGASLVVAGTRGDANLGSDVLRFRTEKGATYRLSGWMRGEKIPPEATLPASAWTSSRPRAGAGRATAFLAQELDAYVAWGRATRCRCSWASGGIRFPSTRIAAGCAGSPTCST